MPSAKVCHIVAAAYEAWGHARPLCTLVATLAKESSFIFTLFTPRRYYPRMLAELSRSFTSEESEARARIRLIGLATDLEKAFDIASLDESFADAYSRLVCVQPITCAATGAEFKSPALTPDAALLDLFGSGMARTIRTVSKKPVKIFAWVTSEPAAFYWLSGLIGPNADGKARERINAEVAATGEAFDDVTHKVFRPTKGNVAHIPGIPPLYDWEQYPQHHMTKRQTGEFFLSLSELFLLSDGVVFSSPLCFDPPEIIEHYVKHGEETGRKPYWLGPVVPYGKEAVDAETKQSAHANEILEFLDRMLDTHGPNSAVYFSLGSMFWPADQSKMWQFLQILVEQGKPVLFSHASRFAQIPEDIAQKLRTSGLVYLSPWSPQQTVLNHPAIGWFVTHAGFNSVLESIMAGVPMICWPFTADQPVISLHLTNNLRVAYELLSVRSGHGLKPLHRTGEPPKTTPEDVREETLRVLDLAYGEDGEEKRRNILKLRDQFLAAWQEGGTSRRAVKTFLDSI